MRASEISRVQAKPDNTLVSNAQLVQDAEKYLGYQSKRIPIYGELSQALAKLEIEPLNRKDVERYKASKAYVQLSNKAKAGIFFLSYALLLGIANWQFDWNNHKSVANISMFAVNALSVIAFIAWAIWSVDADKVKKFTKWEKKSLHSYYGHYVPEFALSKAVEIKKACPSVNMYVEELITYEHREPRRDPDPFLVAEHGSEVFYLDVWDEPEFERQTR